MENDDDGVTLLLPVLHGLFVEGFAPHASAETESNLLTSDDRRTRKGLDWNAVLTDHSEDDRRNGVIVDSILAEPDRVWLVLVEHVARAELLKRLINERSTSNRCATLVVGSATKFDATVDVLIGTTSKIGVGFDHSADALCSDADVKYYLKTVIHHCSSR